MQNMIRRDIVLSVEQVNVHVAVYVFGLNRNTTQRPMKCYGIRYKKSTSVNTIEMAGYNSIPIHQQSFIIIYENLWLYPFGVFQMFRSIGCKCICLLNQRVSRVMDCGSVENRCSLTLGIANGIHFLL